MHAVRKVILLLDGSRAFDRGLLRGIAQYANLHGPWVFHRRPLFYQSGGSLRHDSARELARFQADGVIMNSGPHDAAIRALRLPTVIVPSRTLAPSAVNLVDDNAAIGAMAADHLLGLGLRHFAFCGIDGMHWSLQRRDSFLRKLAARGQSAESHLLPASPHRRPQRQQEESLGRWLRHLPKPVGVLACNDEFARTLVELCRLEQLKVPDQVAVVGVDNDELICELSSPPISSIPLQAERGGFKAAAALERMMARRKAARRIIRIEPGQLIPRRSTDLIAVEDAELAAALRFIRDNVHRLIQIEDVAEATGLSRRTLYSRFQHELGRSVRQEIDRCRLAYLRHLLQTTRQPIGRIAARLGHADARHFARYFRKHTGLTPQAYRKQFGRL